MRLPKLRQALARTLASTMAAALLVGCGTSVAADSASTASTSSNATTSSSAVVSTDATTVAGALADNVEVEAGDTSYDEAHAIDVTLTGSAAESDSDAVTSEDGTVTISAAGTCVLSGDLTGQMLVSSTGDGVVRLVLDDATITSETSAAINVVDAESVVVALADGSRNSLTDAAAYDDTSDEAPTGALYSTADLTIGGTGSLTVTANANNGIVGKDGLVITGGAIAVAGSYEAMEGSLIIIDGGDIVVYGPTTDGNGALDVSGTFEITGGTLVATCSAGMMVAPSTDSGQGWLATALAGTATAGSEVVITDADGTEVAMYTIEKDFASVVFSSADIEQGSTYTVAVDGTETTVTAGEAPAGGRGPMGG